MFAFDHRDSFRRIIASDADDDVVAAKSMLFDSFRDAHRRSPDPGMAMLIDEQYGGVLIAEAQAAALAVIVPIERSGQRELSFEYGDEAYAHVERVDPAAVKVLVRWDPLRPSDVEHRQGDLLAQLDEWMHDRGRTLIVEFLAPPERDSSRRADALCAAIEQIRAAGCHPPLWKVEGLDDVEHAQRVGDAVAGGPRPAEAIVLGRGVDMPTVERWLSCAAQVPQFAGFAIGKTLWEEPLQTWRRGGAAREETVAEVARRYLRLIEVWQTERAYR